ncbi:MAG: hypothetical protein GY868_09970, partial [Deltaproteobacteria bacterium]|nr:hypothetical protein [Deltaproteobacteria bacterium]
MKSGRCGIRKSAIFEKNGFNCSIAAEIRESDIDYVNAHGTGSPLGDKTEMASLKEVFGIHRSELRINSTKSMTGHCLYSAGLVEAIATICQMEGDFVHPNLNLENP